MATTHYGEQGADCEPGHGRSLCGWPAVSVTIELAAVKCKLCLRALARAAAEAPEESAERPFEPSGPEAAELGRRELSETDAAALERSLRGSVERFRWRSAREALCALIAFREDGQGVGSTSNPARFERLPRGASAPDRQVTSHVDAVHGVARALELAFAGPRDLTWTICACGAEWRRDEHAGHGDPHIETVTISAEQQRMVLWWALHERIVREHGRPTVVSVSIDSVRADALDTWGLKLSERHVAMVRDAGLKAVARHLVAIGELAPPERGAAEKGEDMGALGYDLSGWDEIEAYTKMSRKVLRRLSEREADPLPIHEIPGVRGYHAKRSELDAWFAENTQQRGSAA